MVHVRCSTEQNTWTIDTELYKSLGQEDKLRVINKKNKEHTYTKAEIDAMWESRGFLNAANGHPIKVMRFPWHPLA